MTIKDRELRIQAQQIKELRRELERQTTPQMEGLLKYGEQWSRGFTPKYMFWSPNVPKGKKTAQLRQIRRTLKSDIEIVINSEYERRVGELREKARRDASDSGEPFYRALQILEHMLD